ncbi:winged helix-turn-helix transcriptional regulator [Agrobacterium pusense]|uniref:winged helix-turn-helix transcriptional regulator n=1 Tax=Agrobacterium pusense TaxID=648995 RepID=UPI00156B21F5|nr:helix-turn-helix domain-containing protein [Agrobacterium pusense]QKJ94376.1 helix-turn-helix transcriptional regulator [Agrobacterium pusense]
MTQAITHLKVPVNERSACLGPDGSVAHVSRILAMLTGRWKLQILFRLFASQSMRSSQFLRELYGISQKVLTQHLRDLEADGLVERRDFHEQPPHVEYHLTRAGHQLMPVLLAMREYSRDHPAVDRR